MKADKRLELFDALADGHASIFDKAYEGHREDKDFIYAAAIGGNAKATQDFFSNTEYSHLTEDRDFMKRVLSNNSYAVHSVSSELAEDKAFIIDVVKNATSGTAFDICESLSESHLEDRDVAMAAVTNYGMCLVYFDERIKADKEVALHAVTSIGFALECVADKHKDDNDVVLAAVKSDIRAVDYASSRLKSICEGKDPVEAIEAAIITEKMEKMQADLKPKPATHQRGLKI